MRSTIEYWMSFLAMQFTLLELDSLVKRYFLNLPRIKDSMVMFLRELRLKQKRQFKTISEQFTVPQLPTNYSILLFPKIQHLDSKQRDISPIPITKRKRQHFFSS